MFWQWTSRQGNERKTNNDAVAIIDKESFFFTIIVDAAEQGSLGAELAHYWTQTVATFIQAETSCPVPVAIIDFMKEAQKQLRTKFLHEIASYTILLHNKTNKKSSAIICGDCRIGIKQAEGINWLSNVHTLANVEGEFFGAQHNDDLSRHTITRSLNAKRFTTPEIQKLTLDENESWLLCTDGYWAEYIGEQKEWLQLSDDASCLEIAPYPIHTHQSSDNHNCFNYSQG
jgi:serine/threonine protein phosphatase PrpC